MMFCFETATKYLNHLEAGKTLRALLHVHIREIGYRCCRFAQNSLFWDVTPFFGHCLSKWPWNRTVLENSSLHMLGHYGPCSFQVKQWNCICKNVQKCYTPAFQWVCKLQSEHVKLQFTPFQRHNWSQTKLLHMKMYDYISSFLPAARHGQVVLKGMEERRERSQLDFYF